MAGPSCGGGFVDGLFHGSHQKLRIQLCFIGYKVKKMFSLHRIQTENKFFIGVTVVSGLDVLCIEKRYFQ